MGNIIVDCFFIDSHFPGLLPLAELSRAKFTLRPSLAALLHGTRPLGVSQTFRRGTRNGITELLQRAPPIFGWAAITLGIGPHSSLLSLLQAGLPVGQTPVLLQLDRIF